MDKMDESKTNANETNTKTNSNTNETNTTEHQQYFIRPSFK